MSSTFTVATLPKIELHCHLEAALPISLVYLLAQRNSLNHLLAPALGAYQSVADIDDYLKGYDATAHLLRTAGDFAEAVDTYLHSVAQQAVRYVEIFWSPMVHLDDAVPYRTQLAGIIDGIEHSTSGVNCRLIPAIDRSRSPAEAAQVVDYIVECNNDLVVGVGLDYDETLGPADTFIEPFARIRRAGLRATSHAGETAGSDSILDSIDLLGCSRIDHGYAILSNDDDLQRCLDAGVTFTVSTRAAELLKTWGLEVAGAPADMWRRGLRISPATDAPAHFGTTLTSEHSMLEAAGLTVADLHDIQLASVAGTFLDETDRRTLTAELRT
ncbi:hypothetical protein R4P64_18335 [Rhodococcus sp. IEGM 1366]|uniref:adenosine deaminase family protein n=1 Tax=Rhodococcus sp. IEGM 1366 TaxID=3082223 RepID=UPI0029531A02|nr:hypothetical protein [Rhodococcus sp. IEGM 1366]MDV8068478.1 hypothetical protein [Rhodococcus sp. IEGM 1366]